VKTSESFMQYLCNSQIEFIGYKGFISAFNPLTFLVGNEVEETFQSAALDLFHHKR